MSNILYKTNFLQLKETLSKSGKPWIYAHRPNVNGVVVILPVIEKNKVLFLIEERPPLQAEGIAKYSIGLPAGLVGDERTGETFEEAISSELLEETGLKADSIEIVSNKTASSPGCISETVTIAIAYIDNYHIIEKPIDDGGVIINRILVQKDKIRSWLKEKENEGYVLTAQMLAALFFLEEI